METDPFIGQVFTHLTTIEVCGRHSVRRENIYRCRCSCGRMHDVAKSELKSGHVKSCGRHKSKLTMEQRVFRQVYRAYKFSSRAKHKEEFPISFEVFCELVQKPCHYCGVVGFSKQKITRSGTAGFDDQTVSLNGLDRVDPSKGYGKDNVVTCCGQCNVAKNNYSLTEFNYWIKRLAEHQGWRTE